MKFKVYFEPFIELILGESNWSFKKMRFLGRLPYIRNKGRDEIYEQQLIGHKFSDIEFARQPNEIVKEIHSQGFSSSLTLQHDLLSHIEKLVSKTPFVDRKTGEGKYFLDCNNLKKPSTGYLYSIHNPHLCDERLNDFATLQIKPIADAYLAADSVILNSQIWATFPDDENNYNPDFGFHYDLDDYRFLKLFIYLTDVDENCGPHQIIAKSHINNAVFRFFNRRLGYTLPQKYSNNVKVMLGKKGEGFFEDTLCYHKGTRPIQPRLILQLQFALSDKRIEQ